MSRDSEGITNGHGTPDSLATISNILSRASPIYYTHNRLSALTGKLKVLPTQTLVVIKTNRSKETHVQSTIHERSKTICTGHHRCINIVIIIMSDDVEITQLTAKSSKSSDHVDSST